MRPVTWYLLQLGVDSGDRDSVGNRSLAGSTYYGDTTTNEACISFCDSKGYVYAGTEHAGECCMFKLKHATYRHCISSEYH